MVRILLINPNSSDAVTARLRAAATEVASPDTEIEAVTAGSGVPIIETAEQSMATVPAVLEAIDAHAIDRDAVIIAAYSDPGLVEARVRVRMPVFGIAEASMLEATLYAERFSIVTAGPALLDALWDLAGVYGVREKLAQIHLLPWSVAEIAATPERYLDEFRRLCLKANTEDNVRAIVVGGGPLAGLARQLEADLPIPVLDGVACAIRRAERILHGRP